MTKQKVTVLFICTHNSARSQLAEGLMNHFHGDKCTAYSAGTEATLVRPHAIKALAEIGIDISHHKSKTVDEFKDITFDYVVTVCDSAKETCPFFPGAKKLIHNSFQDPSKTQGTENEKRAAFRLAREQIKEWLDQMEW
ncbi:MAG: arsenate reductase ArsC [bacterium]|nr:arsenate reductase ArsC [bacterium]